MVKATVIKEQYVPFKKIGKNMFLFHLNPQDKGLYYLCDEFTMSVYDRNTIISSLINYKYPPDRMDAIRNNYELVRDGDADEKEEEYTKEYLDMQAWRKKAKELADEIMKEV